MVGVGVRAFRCLVSGRRIGVASGEGCRPVVLQCTVSSIFYRQYALYSIALRDSYIAGHHLSD